MNKYTIPGLVQNGTDLMEVRSFTMPAREVRLNKQYLLLLSAGGVPDDVILDLLDDHLEYKRTRFPSEAAPGDIIYTIQGKIMDPNAM